MPQQSALDYIRSGQTPFFRLPCADPHALKDVDAALIGVTFDVGTTYQPGARLAPYHLRRVSALVQPVHPAHGVDIFERVRAVDAGNVAFPPFEPGAMREAVQRDVAALAAAGAVPFVVGGDHSIALPVLRALAAQHGPLAVLHVDAHLDTSGPEAWGTAHHHGTPFRHALAEGCSKAWRCWRSCGLQAQLAEQRQGSDPRFAGRLRQAAYVPTASWSGLRQQI